MDLESTYNTLLENATGQEIFDILEFRKEAREHIKEGELKC